MKNVFYSLIVILLLVSCKNDKKQEEASSIEKLEQKVKTSPNENSLNELKKVYTDKLNDESLSKEEKESVLERAASYFDELGKPAYASSFMVKLIKDFPGAKTQARLKSLISDFDAKGASGVGKVMKMLYEKKYNDGAYNNDISGVETDFDKLIKDIGESIFADLEKTGKLNKKAAKDYVNNCEAYVLMNPDAKDSPEYLFKAAEVAHTIKSYNKTFDLYDWLLEKYPTYEKSPTALFLKGYVLDNELKKYDEAEKLYDEFLQKYPNSDLVDDVKTLKEFMGKSDEEILKAIEANRKKNK